MLKQVNWTVRTLAAAIIVLVLFAAGATAADIAGTYNSDTTLNDGDTWTSGDVTINGSTTVVDIPNAATVTYDQNVNATMNGDGIFRVQSGGMFVHDGPNDGGDNIQLGGSVTFDNLGTFEFASGGDINLNSSTALFSNTGLLWKSGSTGTVGDPSYVFGSGTDTFTNTGTIQVDAGVMNISRGNSTGGTFDVNGTGRLEFEGLWSELTSNATVESGGILAFGNRNPAGTTGAQFTAAAATTVVNVTGDGIDWFGTELDTNTNTISNQGVMHIRTTTATRNLTGAGTLLNASGGVINWDRGEINVAAATAFSNEGTLNVLSGADKIISGDGDFINASGGLTNFNDMTAITQTGNSFVNRGQVDLLSGAVRFEGTAGFHNDTTGTLNFLSDVELTINDTDLTNDGTATFADDGNKALNGNAAFVNNGDFIHSHGGSNDNLIGRGTGGFVNDGTFDFQANGDFDLSSSDYTITNNGLFQRSGASGDATYIFRNGNFVNAAGGEVKATGGKLVLALDNSSSDAGSTWTADGGTIQIGGSWTGTFNGSGPGKVFVGDNGNATVGKNDLIVGAAGITTNITNGGFAHEAEDIDTAGNTFTNTGVFNFNTYDAKSIRGGGTFQNTGAGDMKLISASLTLDATDLTNAATFTIAGTVNLHGTGELINAAGGTMTWTTPSTTSTFTLNTTLRNQGAFTFDADQGRTLDGTGQIINESTGAMTWDTSAGSYSIAINSSLTNQGTFEFTGSSDHTLNGSGTFENAAGATMNWANGDLNVNNDLVNNGTFNYVAGDENLGGSGTFVNNGTFNHASPGSNDNISGSFSGQFLNNGLFDFTNVGDFQLTDNYTFTNMGIVRKTGGGSNESLFFHFGAGDGSDDGGVFDNQGTVEVLNGELRFNPDTSGQFDEVVIAQLSGGTLTGGTWIVDASASGSADLDMAVSSGIDTLGAGAVVKLNEAGSTFAQFNNVATIDGAFYVNGTRSFNLASGFSVSATGTLGGDGTFVGDADIAGILAPGDEGDAGILSFESVVDMTGGSLAIDLDGLIVGSEYDQLAFTGAGPHTLTLSNTDLDLDLTFLPSVGNTFTIVDGFDTQTGIFNGLADGSTFDVDGNTFRIDYNLDNITLTVTQVIPEPVTFVVMGLGAMALIRRRA